MNRRQVRGVVLRLRGIATHRRRSDKVVPFVLCITGGTRMYALDHIPIGYRDLPQLASAFEVLGFTVSGVCVYQSPDDPLESWTCRAVFMDHGWLDLQFHPGSTSARAFPHGCLFRAPSLDSAKIDLSSFRLGPTARLVRTWQDRDAPRLDLGWTSVRERIAPMMLAVVEYPAGDPSLGADVVHPNGARRLLGLAFGGAEAGPQAETAARKLALSGFEYHTQAVFEDLFGRADGPMIALRFAVASCDQTASILRDRGVRFSISERGICVPGQGVLGCGVAFIEADPA